MNEFYRRVKSVILLLTLVVIIIIRGHGFNIRKMHNEAVGFIEKTVKERKLRH